MGYINGVKTPNQTTATRRAERLASQRWLHISKIVVEVRHPLTGLVLGHRVTGGDGPYNKGDMNRSLRRSGRISARQMRKMDKDFRRDVANW